MNRELVLALTGVFGAVGLAYNFASWLLRIKRDEDRKRRRRAASVVYRLGKEPNPDQDKETHALIGD